MYVLTTEGNSGNSEFQLFLILHVFTSVFSIYKQNFTVSITLKIQKLMENFQVTLPQYK